MAEPAADAEAAPNAAISRSVHSIAESTRGEALSEDTVIAVLEHKDESLEDDDTLTGIRNGVLIGTAAWALLFVLFFLF